MNPFGKYRGLKLNGVFYSKKKLRSRNFQTENQSKNRFDALELAADLFSDSDFIEVQTSGSTGTPKISKALKTALETSALATNAFFGLGSNSHAALALPIQYIAGKMMVARAVVGEYELTILEPSSNAIPDFPVDFMPVIPLQIETCFVQNPERIKNVKTFLIGGGKTDDSLREKIGLAEIDAWYSFGMTETLSHFALAKAKTESEPLYHPLAGVEIGMDENNRLTIYWPGITEGVLQTNDLVKLVGGGFIWLGRSDNLINSGGVKITPEEVEGKLSSHIRVPFFVAGVPDSKLGEEVVLFTEIEKVTLPGNIEWDNPYQKPRKSICIQQFERTLSGKIKRKATVEKWLKAGYST